MSSSNGAVYVITVQDEYRPHPDSDDLERCVDDQEGTLSYNQSAIGCARHAFRWAVDPYETLPYLYEPPDQEFEDLTQNHGDELPPDTIASMEGYLGQRSIESRDVPDADDRTTYGVYLDWSHPDRILNEAWLAVYEGVLPGTSRASGNVQPPSAVQAEFLDRAANFCTDGVVGQSECRGNLACAGDRLQITSEPAPVDDATDCRAFAASEEAPLEYLVAKANRHSLIITTINAPLPDPLCFPYAVEYRIRASGQWLIHGQTTGFLHHRIANADGECFESPTPTECGPITCDSDTYGGDEDPLNRTTLDGPIECLLDGRAFEGEPFANPFFCFTLNTAQCGTRPTELCNADGTFDTPEDSFFEWTVRGGFQGVRIGTGALPSAMRYNAGDGRLYVIDQSNLGLIEVRLDTFTAVASYL